jgi:hypothetical protein
VVWFLWAVVGHVSLLFAEETSSFCHEVSFFLITEGVPGTDGIYVHSIWVMRGSASPLSALSKVLLPLVPSSQVSLVPH